MVKFGLLLMILAGGFLVESAPITAAPLSDDVVYTGPHLGITSQANREILALGHQALLEFRFEDAEESFSALVQTRQTKTVGLYLLAKTALWKAIACEKEAAFELFQQRAKRLDNHFDYVPNSAIKTWIEAEYHRMQAFASLKHGETFSGIMHGRRAIKLYKKCRKKYPNFNEAQLGSGLLRVLLGTLPSGYRWALSMIGYDGDIQSGMHIIFNATLNGGFVEAEAKLYFGLMDITFNQSQSNGLEILADLTEEYPKSILFNHMYGYGLLKHRRANEAEAYFRKSLTLQNDPAYYQIDYSYYLLATTQYRLNNFEDAAVNFTNYLTSHTEGNAFILLACYRNGISLELSGRRNEAVNFYHIVKDPREMDEEEHAVDQAKIRLRSPQMSENEVLLLKGRNAWEAGNEEQVIEIFSVLLDSNSTETWTDANTEAAFWTGRSHHILWSLEDAQDAYALAISNQKVKTAQWAAWSTYYLGRIYEAQDNLVLAKSNWDTVMDWPADYDFKRSLELEIKVALEGLSYNQKVTDSN